MKVILRNIVVLVLLLTIFISCSPQKSDAQMSKIKELLGQKKIYNARLVSFATDDGFNISKEDAVKLLEHLAKSKSLKEARHDKEYYYNQISFYDSENKELFIIRCINPTGSKENRQVIINDFAYQAESFYKFLYDIGKKESYYLDLDKF